MPPKIAVFSALSPRQKEVFYQYFIENDTKFSYNPKSNTYIATIISPPQMRSQSNQGAIRSSSTGSQGNAAEKGPMKTIMTEFGSLVPVLGCKPSVAQTNITLDITSLLRFMTHVYEEHYYEFIGSAHNLEQPSFLREGSPLPQNDAPGRNKISSSNKGYYNFTYFILHSRSLAIYKRSLPANSTGPNMASLIWVIIINLNKYRLNSVFVSAFLMLLLSTFTPSHVLGLFTTLQHELKEQIVLASHTQLQAKPLIQVASRILNCEIRTQSFISTLVDRHNQFLSAGMDSTVYSREFLLFIIDCANRGEAWTQIQEESILRNDDSLPGHLSTRNNDSFLQNERTASADPGIEGITDRPVVDLKMKGEDLVSAPPSRPTGTLHDSNPLLTKLAAESPMLSKSVTPMFVANASSVTRIPDSTTLSESRLKRNSTMTRSRVSGFYGADDDDDRMTSVSQSGFRRRMIPHEEIYPPSFNTAFMIDETSFVTLLEGLGMILPPVVTLFCEKFHQEKTQTDENIQLLIKELLATLSSDHLAEASPERELILQRSFRELLRTEVHTPKIILRFVKNLFWCLGERLGLDQ